VRERRGKGQSIVPHFLGVGAAKAGTTSLHRILNQHPDICLPKTKELHFFDNDKNYQKGIKWYSEQLCKNYNGEFSVGEITPSYMYLKKIPIRIHRQLQKNIKFIFMLRHPVDRAYSHYLMNVRYGHETRSFEDVVKNESNVAERNFVDRLRFSYLERGLYAKQIYRYINFFPIENMFFIIFESDFLNDRMKTIFNLQTFLEIKSVKLDVDIKSNPSSITKAKILAKYMYNPNIVKKIIRFLIPADNFRNKLAQYIDERNLIPYNYPKLNRELRRSVLEKYFIEDILALENLINRNLDIWHE
jgi:hypothetical protein